MTYPHPEDERYDDIGLETICGDCGGHLRHLPWCEAEDEDLPADDSDTGETPEPAAGEPLPWDAPDPS